MDSGSAPAPSLILVPLFLLSGFATAVCGAALLKAWLVDQTIDIGFALAILFAICATTGGIMKLQNATLLVWWSLGLVAVCMLLQPLGEQANKRALKRMTNEDIEKYKRALEFDPNNSSAHRFLADIYLKQNRYDEAIAEYKAAIKLDPHDVAALRRKLNYVLDLRQQDPHAKVAAPGTAQSDASQPDVTMCPACRMDTPSAGKTCEHCGEQINLGFVEWIARPDNYRDIMRQSTLAMLVAIILLTVFTALPIEVKACVLCASVLVGGVYLMRSTGA